VVPKGHGFSDAGATSSRIAHGRTATGPSWVRPRGVRSWSVRGVRSAGT
jgi:hypothetical protein